jgi:FkbM family methyltransferase
MRITTKLTVACAALVLIGVAAYYRQRVSTLKQLLTEQQSLLQQIVQQQRQKQMVPYNKPQSSAASVPPPGDGAGSHPPLHDLITLIESPRMKVELAVEEEGDCHKSVIRPRVDFKGGDLPKGHLHPASSVACDYACWEMPKCSRWVYYQTKGTGECWLKDGSAEMLPGGEELISGELDKTYVRADPDPLDCWFSKISAHLPTLLNKLTQLHGTVIDVGANVGAFSAAIREKCSTCEIVMFEAVPDYASYCERHKDNHMDVVRKGLSDGSGQASFWVSKDPLNLGWNTMVEAEADKAHMEERVLSFVTFDSWLEGHASNGAPERAFEKSISVIKIDTEGAEYRVLKGMRGYLARAQPKPTLLIEVAWGPRKHPKWQEEMEAFEWLFAHGYRRNQVATITETTDVLFQPI